ncbi:hypothetical protein CcaCcLH18_08307 [Colletotrichum camelliae]|nr:hypothetical protein CcaCcLH18_08307 [Colletotrichum camelliae]
MSDFRYVSDHRHHYYTNPYPSICFGKNGYPEGTSGHISVRDPILPNYVWMNPFAVHFNQLKASDMVLVDTEGYVVEGGNQVDP